MLHLNQMLKYFRISIYGRIFQKIYGKVTTYLLLGVLSVSVFMLHFTWSLKMKLQSVLNSIYFLKSHRRGSSAERLRAQILQSHFWLYYFLAMGSQEIIYPSLRCIICKIRVTTVKPTSQDCCIVQTKIISIKCYTLNQHQKQLVVLSLLLLQLPFIITANKHPSKFFLLLI